MPSGLRDSNSLQIASETQFEKIDLRFNLDYSGKASDLNSVTSITYDVILLWPLNSPTNSILGGGGGQRWPIDLRASPQVKTWRIPCIFSLISLLPSSDSSASVLGNIKRRVRHLRTNIMTLLCGIRRSALPVAIRTSCARRARQTFSQNTILTWGTSA